MNTYNNKTIKLIKENVKAANVKKYTTENQAPIYLEFKDQLVRD